MKINQITFFAVFLFCTNAYSQPDGLRVTLGTIANSHSVRMEVNGQHIAGIQGGRSQAVQLFHIKYPHQKQLPPNLQYVNCLREGRNTIKIKYDLIGESKGNLPLHFYMNSVAYSVPIFEFEQKEKKSGEIESEFEVFQEMPKGYKTVTLKEKIANKP